MTGLSAETRRLLELSRGGDVATPEREQTVRNRLVARLGATALAGVASTAVAMGGTKAGTAVGTAAAKAVSAGATTATLAKTAVALALVAGLGTEVWKRDNVAEQVVALPAATLVQAKQAAKRVWRFVTGETEDTASPSRGPSADVGTTSTAERRHERLMEIARRPSHPVAKEAELVLILGAEQELETGNHERAAAYLREHEERFSGGELSRDREVLRVEVERVRSGGSPWRRAAPSPVAPPGADKTNF